MSFRRHNVVWDNINFVERCLTEVGPTNNFSQNNIK